MDDQEDYARLQRCLTPEDQEVAPECAAGNLDGDLDVDQQDLAIFRACFSGPAIPARATCLP